MITLKAPAKINFGLEIPFKYPNGYHHIVSIFTMINLFDRLELKFQDKTDFEFSWKNELPFNSQMLYDYFESCTKEQKTLRSNLLYRAWSWFNEQFPLFSTGVSLCITKRIPSPSGLGGGSSDAAALLVAMADRAKVDLLPYLTEISKVGADIPYCVWWQKNQSAALISGIGIPKQSIKLPKMVGVLGLSGFDAKSSMMFSALKKPLHDKKRSHLVLYQIERSILKGCHNQGIVWLQNDFWDVYDKSQKELLESAMQMSAAKLAQNAGQVFVSISGSGSAFFALATGQPKLDLIIPELQQKLPEFEWIAVTTKIGL